MSQSPDLSIFHYFDMRIIDVPALMPASANPSARFLFDESTYNQKQENRETTRLGSYYARPVLMDRDKSYFVKAFLESQPLPEIMSGNYNYWEMALPFVLTPVEPCSLRVSLDGNEIELRVDLEVLVWPTGWSSSVNFEVFGQCSYSDLECLCRAAVAQPVFSWQEQPSKLSHIFQRLDEGVRNALFHQPSVMKRNPSLNRYNVVLLACSYDGYVNYRERSGADKVQLLRILRSGPATDIERIRLEKEKAIKFTWPLHARDFGIIEPARGILYSAYDAWRSRRRESVRCLASNIKKSAQWGLALAKTAEGKWSGFAGAEQPQSLERLAARAHRTLFELPTHYDNRTANLFWRTHPATKPYCLRPQSDGEEDTQS